MSRRISVVLDLQSGQFTAGMAGAANATSRLNINLDLTQGALNRVERRMSGLLETTRDLTVILGQARTALYNLRVVATGWIEAVVRTNAEMERMTFLLANMSDSLTVEERFRDAGDSLDYLFEKAKQAPFSVNALTDSFVKMKSSGLDPTMGGLDGLTNAVAAFGGTDQTLHRASIAIQQMAGKGVISMEELRQQLGEAVPSAVALMARSMNLSYRELVDRVSKGQVEASSALAKMFGEFERTFGGSSQAMMDTFAGKVSVAKTSLIEMSLAIGGFDREAGRFVEGGLMSTINAQIQAFIDALKTPEAALFAQQVGEALTSVFTAFNALVGIIIKYQDAIITAGKWFLIYFGARTAVASVMALTTAFRGLLGVAGTLPAALRGIQSSAGLASVAIQIFGQRAATARELAVALGQATVGVGRGLMALAGPVAAGIAIMLAAADAFGLFENKVNRASEAAQNFIDGFATLEDIKNVQERLVEIQGDIQRAEAAQNNFVAVRNPFTGTDIDGGAERRRLEERTKSLYEERARLETSLQRGLTIRRQYESDRAADQAIKSIERETQRYVSAYNKQAQAIQGERDALASDETVSEAERKRKEQELNERSLANTQDLYAKQEAVLKNFLDGIESQKRRVQQGINLPYEDVVAFGGTETAEQKLAALTAAQDKATEALVNFRETAARQTQVAIDPNVFFAGVNNGGNTTAPQADPVGNLIDSLSRRNAGLQAELNDTGKEIAKVEEQIRIWGQSGVAVTDAQAQAMRDYANSIDAAGIKIKQNREDEQSMGRLTDQLQRQADTARELSAVLAGGYSEIEAEAAIFKIRLDQIVEGLHEGKEAAALMAQETAELFAQNRASEFLIGLKRTTQEINTGLLSGNEAAQARHDADIARIYEIVNLNQFAGEERMRMEAIVNDYITARGEQLKRETEGRFRGMLREWTDTTAAMDQAAAGWMDSFINALVEGKASFGDFAKAILADIAKIIIRALIAQAILAAIGAVGGATGGGGPTNLLANRVPADAGGLTSSFAGSIYHNGGVVGSDRGMTKTVSAAVFAAAKRFHSGGLVGLKNDEVPAILQTGERVLNREETRAYGSRGATAMNVQVNIINEGGERMQEKSRNQRFDGESFIIDIVTQAAGQPGKMRNAIKDAARS